MREYTIADFIKAIDHVKAPHHEVIFGYVQQLRRERDRALSQLDFCREEQYQLQKPRDGYYR